MYLLMYVNCKLQQNLNSYTCTTLILLIYIYLQNKTNKNKNSFFEKKSSISSFFSLITSIDNSYTINFCTFLSLSTTNQYLSLYYNSYIFFILYQSISCSFYTIQLRLSIAERTLVFSANNIVVARLYQTRVSLYI